MATTGELRTIIEELELVDIGDAASYLGEEIDVEEEFSELAMSGYLEEADGCKCK